jgi:hypothetical protein
MADRKGLTLLPCVRLNSNESSAAAGFSFTQGIAPILELRQAGDRQVLNTYTSYQLITRDIDRSLEQVEEQPSVKRETEYYLANIPNIKSVDDFVGDTRIFKYAMKAFGLEDMDYAKAFMKKVLTEGIDSEHSFANKLSDRRYRQFAETFNFARYGDTATVFGRTRQGTVDKYLRQTLEQNAGEQNQGVQLALYFERKASASGITSWYSVLADKALTKVIYTALGLPDSFLTADIDKQVAYFDSKLDLEDFTDPDKLDEFLKRYTALWELDNPTQTAQSSVSVLFTQPEYGISTDLLLTMQRLKF